METSENHKRIDGITAPVHIDFEKIIDLHENHQFILPDGEIPMVVEEIQGYSDEKLVRCNNIIVAQCA